MTYKIVTTELRHVEELAMTMRAPDIRECWAAQHYSPLHAIKHSLYRTEKPWTGLLDDMVMCIWGVGKVSYLSKEGIPWMLTSTLVDEHYKVFLRKSKPLLKDMFKEANVLVNMVDARNFGAIKWLKWLGFDVLPPRPFGPDDLLFHPFILENTHV